MGKWTHPSEIHAIHVLCRRSEDRTCHVLETGHIRSPVHQGMCSQSSERNITPPFFLVLRQSRPWFRAVEGTSLHQMLAMSGLQFPL